MDNMVPYYVVMCLLHAYNKRENTYFLKVRFGLEFVYSVLFTLPKIPWTVYVIKDDNFKICSVLFF